MDPTYPHDVIAGEEALLVAAAKTDAPPLALYQWEFGDGMKSDRIAVTDPLALEARHVYVGPLGRIFKATVTAWDETGATAKDDYYVRIRPDTPRTRAYIACGRALWNLHKTMSRGETDGVPVGYWESPGKAHRVGITAACVQAFENMGNFPFDNPEESPYVEDVQRGINQLLLDMKAESISPQKSGDPDLNGNGIGLLCHHEASLKHLFSSQGLAIVALVMSRAPERLATVGGPRVLDRKFIDIVQDMADFVAFGQTDDNPEEIVVRGGWRYDRPNCGEADLACTEWPVCGLMIAEKNWGEFGVRVPAWVKTELRGNFLVAGNDAGTGGWRYMPNPANQPNVGLTGIGLLCSAWTGIPLSDAMVQSGLSYIAANWDSKGQFGHFTSMFNMYAIAAAMKAYGNKMIGDHDWYQEYVEHLINSQKPDGSWLSEGYEGSWPIATAWGVLILLEPQTPPSIAINQPESAVRGPAEITYRLFDDNYDECDLLVEFSSDRGGTWRPATQCGGDGLADVEASPDGLPRRFIWDTSPDVGRANIDNVLVRIIPSDGEKGKLAQVTIPGVYNDVTPFVPLVVNAPSRNGRGVAMADFDNDGDLDVFVANFGQENFLLRNDSGTLVESARLAGLEGSFASNCGVWGDFNNDGAIDLYLVLAGQPNRLYAGNGLGSFTEVASQVWAADAGGGMCAAWGDYDRDNWLDLYVGNDPAFGYGGNSLYHNLGVFGFLNLAGVLGVSCPSATHSAAWCDFDSDGKIDLYVANSSSSPPEQSNSLFHNPGDTSSVPFQDVASSAGVSDSRNSVAVVWADFNNDSLFDIYLVNGGADANTLYLNNGDGTFRDETARAGVAGPLNATGAAAADFDNDGDLDIFVSARGRNFLYMNRGDCTFVELASLVGMSDVADSRGAAWGDINGDGFLDLYVANNGAKDILYLNGGEGGNWLKVRCLTDADGDATDDNYADDRDAIGAVVAVDLDGDADFSPEPPDRLLVQCVDGGCGCMSQGQLWPHFGLGGFPIADVRVIFPDGSVVYRCGVSANQTVLVRDIAPRGDFYVQVFTPQAPRSGSIAFGYVIFNSIEKYCDITVEYSFDAGNSWKTASIASGSEGMSGLLSSPKGVFHSFIWDSFRDLGRSNHDTVRVRITPFCPDAGQPGETGSFSVYNDTAPRAFVETPSGINAREISIRYTLADIQGDECSILVEYSVDSGKSWRTATAGKGGEGTMGLASSSGGAAHVYSWDSLPDIGHSVQNNVKIRITPSDRLRGIAGESGLFAVDNNLPPLASVETPATVQSENVVLRYRLLDSESDACSVGVFYSLDGGRTWVSASMAPGGDGTAGLKSSPHGEPHTYVWNSLGDIGLDYSAMVRMTVLPHDAKPGTPAQTGDFIVDNLRPAELAYSPSSFSFSAQEGGESPPPQSLQVWNKGGHSLEWSAATDAGWLAVRPTAGSSSGEKDTVEVSVDITGLPAGTYTGNIILSAAPLSAGSPATIPVFLEVSPPPSCLSVLESVLSFRASEGAADPPPQYIHVRNVGGGDMPWQAETNREWISISPASGSSAGETDTVEVRVRIGHLSLGSYSGAITVSAPQAIGSPHVVMVSLDIHPAPREMTVSPKQLSFATRRGGPNPPQQELRLKVSGGAATPWEARHDVGWLSLSPSSGTNSGEETVIRVAVEKAGLNIGWYRAEVTFAAVGFPLAPQKVVVALDVLPILVPDEFPSIQMAINDAVDLDVVRVKPGFYLENIQMKDGVEVIGSGADVTVIHASRSSSVVVFQHIRSAVIGGFTISGGTGDFFGTQSRMGGGIYCYTSTATLSKCVISGNSASWGGGVCADGGSTITLEDCSISQNAAVSGGAVFCYENCHVSLIRTRVFDNSVIHYGAGVDVASTGSIVLKSCSLFANSAGLGGAGIFVAEGAFLEVVSSTIAGNLEEGILAEAGSSVSIFNTILWSNAPDLVIPAGQCVGHCDIGTGDFDGGGGVISLDPCFVAPDEGCYDLLPNSPCIDIGLNDAPGLPATDIHGEPRIVGVIAAPITDIGADEHDPQRIFVLVQPDPRPGLAGEVLVPFSLWNARSLPASIAVEFSVGGSEWRPAARADGEGTMDLSTSPTGLPHSFVWDSVPDLKGEVAKSLRVRVRLRGEDVGPGATTAAFSLDKTLSDSDNDGLPDAWEEKYFGEGNLSQIPTGDPDGDGSTNLVEYLARTNPLDARSNFRAFCAPGEGRSVVIRWESVRGRFYQVYRCQKMGDQWVPFGPRTTGSGQTVSVVDDTLPEGGKQCYYRIRVE